VSHSVRVSPGYRKQLMGHVLTELAARQARDEEGEQQYQTDICNWAEKHFYIPLTGEPMVMPLHQKAVLRYFFTRRENHHFPYQTVVYSTIKKSGKSTIAGVIARYFAETQTRFGEIFTIGNDLEQAKDRSYKEVSRSLELTPGYNHYKDSLPGRWNVQKMTMRCLLTGSTIKAIAVDAAGEAGGQQALTIWTELWGAENQEAKRFWDEMTPIPTVPDSIRLVETYAGYDGESELLRGLYDVGMDGHQLTAGELADFVCQPDVPGESYEDFVNCWHETRGDPEVKIPIWVNKTASLGMYWDSGITARRMPWQHSFVGKDKICNMCRSPKSQHEIGIPAEEYYAGQEKLLPTQAYRRLHFNEWIGAESAFVPIEVWDSCANVHEVLPIQSGERTPLVSGIDAAVTGDCFGIVVVSRCSQDNNAVDIRALKKWDPKESGGTLQLEEPEKFLREACKPENGNIVQIAYDPYQLESMAQRIRKDGVAWMEPFNQMGDRLKADSQLYDLIIGKRIHYSHDAGCSGGVLCSCRIAPLREHIANANGKVQKDEDSKIRIVKKAAGRKIDLCVSLSMASYRCLYLRL
jgi:phage terminase large subunit-like protein